VETRVQSLLTPLADGIHPCLTFSPHWLVP
jgi:hypothetical protein